MCDNTASCGKRLPYLLFTVTVGPLSCQEQNMDKESKVQEVHLFCYIPFMLCCIYSIFESSVNKTIIGCFVVLQFTTITSKRIIK